MDISFNVDELIARSRRYVAFLDVLGYDSIISSDLEESRKFRRLYSLFETLGEAVDSTLHEVNPKDEVKAISFSDSLYFSATDLVRLLEFLGSVFSAAYMFQINTYEDDQDNWIPFVRAGIVEGWTVSFRDMTLKKISGREVFRNPVGPAVAEAYKLTEKRGRLPGMRCFLEEALFARLSPDWSDNPPHYSISSTIGPPITSPLRFFKVPQSEVEESNLRLVELAWPCYAIDSDNSGFLNPISLAKRQFSNDGRVRRHYEATVDLIRRSVEVCEDANAQEVWGRMGEDLRLPERRGYCPGQGLVRFLQACSRRFSK